MWNMQPREVQSAFSAAAVAAGIVATVGAGAYIAARQRAEAQADQMLSAHAATVFASEERPVRWDMLEPQFELSYPQGQRPALCVFWGSTQDSLYYRSKTWPVDCDPRTVLPSIKVPETWKKSRRGGARLAGAGDTEAGTETGSPATFGSDLEEEAFENALKPARVANVEVQGRPWHMAAFVYENQALILGRNMRPLYAALSALATWLALACPMAFGLVYATVYFTARRRGNEMEQLAQWFEQLSAETLTRRVTLKQVGDQNEPLMKSINEMMDRLEFSYEDARRFSGLAAHELKTPLAILQGKLDIAIHEQLPGSPWQRFLAELLEDVGRLKGVTEKLLLLSRADAGRLDLNIVDVNLSELIEQHVQDTELLAPELQIENHVPADITIQADKTLINVLLQNLFANAIKHNSGGRGAFIAIDLREIPNGIRLAVSNSAKPIPPELHQRIFSRFGRGTAPHESPEGAGLGLSLAYEIARVHGGRLKLKESTHEQTTFVVKLRKVPLPPPNVSTNWRLLKRIEPLSSNPV
jgi:signal transduction histidine kinase